MKILMLGGNWDTNGGRPSSIINQIHNNLNSKLTEKDTLTFYNGGNYSDLTTIIETVTDYEVVFWFANVPNNLPKVRNIKQINPNVLLIGSKSNIDNKYTFVDVLNRTLMQRHNLSILFQKQSTEKNYSFLLFDPLGTEWYAGTDIAKLTDRLYDRISFLLTTTRRHTYKLEQKIEIQNNETFFDYVRDVAKIFHETIQHTDGVTRFMGNASFRGPNNIIYVSERDVDKSLIDINHFVAAFTDFETDKTYYYGDKKPSKDTIVQTYLYSMFPNINYIIHSHCYIEGGVPTTTPVPCGSLNEIDEIKQAMEYGYRNNYNKTYYKFNLKGHGMLLMAATIDELKQTKYITRQLPEITLIERKF